MHSYILAPGFKIKETMNVCAHDFSTEGTLISSILHPQYPTFGRGVGGMHMQLLKLLLWTYIIYITNNKRLQSNCREFLPP